MEVLSRAARAPRVRNKEKKSIRDDGGSQGSDLWLRDEQLSGGGRGGEEGCHWSTFGGGLGGGKSATEDGMVGRLAFGAPKRVGNPMHQISATGGKNPMAPGRRRALALSFRSIA